MCCTCALSAAPVPTTEDASTLYAIAVAISLRATRKNLANVNTYLQRLPKEHEVFAIRDATAREEDLMNTAAFGDWASRNHKDLI